MRQFGAWKWGLALLVGFSASAVSAADRDEDDSAVPRARTHGGPVHSGPGLINKLFGDDKPRPIEKKPAARSDKESAARSDKETARSATKPSKPASVADEAAAERKREQDTLLRRLAVCDKLTEIAVQTRDVDLQHVAEQLEERAQTAYAQRTAHLPCSNAGRFESDEQTLKKHLGAGAAVNGRQAGTPPSLVQDANRNGRAAAREDRP